MSDLLKFKIRSEKLTKLYDYWVSESANGGLLSRNEINPAAICESLPNTIILDVTDDSREFHFRYAGTEIDGRRGQFLTDKYVGDIEVGGLSADSVDTLRDVVEQCEPRYFKGEFRDADGALQRYERVAMPLSTDGKTVDAILAGVRYAPIEFPELEAIDMACFG